MPSLPPIIDKLLLVITNFASIYPLLHCRSMRDVILIGMASIVSSLHHSAEERFYGPVLLAVTPEKQWWLLQADRFFAFLAIVGVGSWKLFYKEWFIIVMAFLAMLASDGVMYIPDSLIFHNNKRFMRVVLHSFWHLVAEGYIAYMAVTRYGGEPRLYSSIHSYLKMSKNS